MDFVVGFPKTVRGNDSIWVIIDRLTKSVVMIPVRATDTVPKLAKLYIDKVIARFGIPVTITSDRGPQFTSKLWKSLHEQLGTRVQLSTAFHPQTDGQAERMIQVLEDILRCCALEFGGSWEEKLSLVEFTYNNSYQASIGVAPFEALYGRRCRTPLCWEEVGDRILLTNEIVEQTTEVVKIITQNMEKAQNRQSSWANKRRRPLEFELNDEVYLKIAPWKGAIRFGKGGKLAPRYIGPYKIVERIGKLAYKLELPEELARVHDVFHVSMLKKAIRQDDKVLPEVPIQVDDKLIVATEPVQIKAREMRVLRNKTIPLVRVVWRSGLIEEETWEPETKMKSKYPHLFD